MATKILTLRYSPELGVIDDGPLQAFGRDHEVLGVREYFFVAQELPHLLCVVSYRPRPCTARPAPSMDTKRESRQRATPDPPTNLSKHERQLFDTIRQWRAAVAERDGVPRYVVLTNRDVEALVRAQPTTLTALRRLPGIGKAKVEKYGEALLGILHPPQLDPPHLVPEVPAPEVAQA